MCGVNHSVGRGGSVVPVWWRVGSCRLLLGEGDSGKMTSSQLFYTVASLKGLSVCALATSSESICCPRPDSHTSSKPKQDSCSQLSICVSAAF